MTASNNSKVSSGLVSVQIGSTVRRQNDELLILERQTLEIDSAATRNIGLRNR